MRRKLIVCCSLGRSRLVGFLVLSAALVIFGLTCNGDEGPTTPGPAAFDPSRPTIESFTAARGGEAIEDGIVYGGEDIELIVEAISHAFPASCGLSESETVEGNLLYEFKSNPPEGVDAPGLISQATPPSNVALWRVPDLTTYDPGEGLVYILDVAVTDECLGNQTAGLLSLRAFANQGAPKITDRLVQSAVDSGDPVTEQLDRNGLYEVERSDECRITLTAESKTSASICANRGVAEGDELLYIWNSPTTEIDLAFDEDPTEARIADFDVPIQLPIGDIFRVECEIRDACTGTASSATFRFIVVGAPQITSLAPSANDAPLAYDPFFDTYEVLPADKVVLTAGAEVMDDALCDSKGIHPDLLWDWQELTGSNPSVVPEFEPLPIPNDTSSIEFVVPAAENGTEYEFRCIVTDRCNSLTDRETARFLVIVPPEAALTFVECNSEIISPAPKSGRYEIQAGDTVRVRVTASAASSSSFCQERGVSHSPPVLYDCSDPWNLLVLNYHPTPSLEYCDVVFVVPENAPPLEASLSCRIEDLCNELVTELEVPFEVVETGGD
jgi:hypothetical protein